ncbi:MAG: phage-shock protein [Candidatus Hydrogenedentota bacterium]|nr:MAG: phage-shock protein [Candidatus Hydrogenedentota bacterium]
MESVFIIAVSGLVAVMIIGTIGVSIFLIVKASQGGGGKKSKQADADETQLIQEIYHGLSKMEERVESLETLLMQSEKRRREGKKMSDFDKELGRE